MIHPNQGPAPTDPEKGPDDDRKWFKGNPGRQFRLRFATTYEIAKRAESHGPLHKDVVNVLCAVRQIGPGQRMRMLLDITNSDNYAFLKFPSFTLMPQHADEEISRWVWFRAGGSSPRIQAIVRQISGEQ